MIHPGAGWTRERNLVRVDEHGDVMWRAELPAGTGADCFVDLRSIDAPAGEVTATTWSGYVVILSGETGRLLSSQFVK